MGGLVHYTSTSGGMGGVQITHIPPRCTKCNLAIKVTVPTSNYRYPLYGADTQRN